MEKFQHKYRIPSARASFWNYGSNAAYFITICTKGRQHFFGKITDGQMVLSEIGEIVESEWLKTFDIRPDMNLQMGPFVVMPNHFHGIIIIGINQYNSGFDDGLGDAMHCVSTGNNQHQQFGPQSKNLASVIRGFKIGVTKNARHIDPHFAWQGRYHDHIIRNDASYQRISAYIVNNPLQWSQDRFY